MAATSPYQENNYQAVSAYQPYQLPINDIMKAFVAQDSFWKAGAARVNSVYENALNLKLSLEPNKEIRRKFMEDADKQLSKLSSMNLADPSVQRQGFSIFKPLFQDDGIMYDDLATRHYEKVRNDALMYRNKDNGKYYHDNNLQYAMQGYEDFVKSKDRMAGKAAFEKRKEYIPYVDISETVNKALSNCTPYSLETNTPQYNNGSPTGYSDFNSIKKLSREQTYGCILSSLNSKELKQLQIDGVVSYKGNKGVLASDTIGYLSGVSNDQSEEVQRLAGQKAAIHTMDISDEEKAILKKSIDEQIKNLSSEIRKNNTVVEKLNKGDLSPLEEDYDAYAGTVYTYRNLQAKAMAFSYEQIKKLYKDDPVQRDYLQFKQEEHLMGMRNAHDKEMARIEHEYALIENAAKEKGSASGLSNTPHVKVDKDGNYVIDESLLRDQSSFQTKPAKDDDVYRDIQDELTSLNEKSSGSNLQLYNTFIDKGDRSPEFATDLMKGFGFTGTWDQFKVITKGNNFSQFGKPGIHETEWFKSYAASNPRDDEYKRWADTRTLIQSSVEVMNRKLELGESEVMSKLEQKVKPMIEKIPTQTIASMRTTVTAEDMISALSGKQGRLTIYSGGPRLNTGTKIERNTFSPDVTPTKFFIDGVEVKDPSDYGKLSSMHNEAMKVHNVLSKERSAVYSNMNFNREGWYFTPDNKSPFVQSLNNSFLNDEGKSIGITVHQSDFAGNVKINVPGINKKSDGVINKLKQFATEVEVLDDGLVLLKGTTYNLIPQAINNPILKNAAYHLYTLESSKSFKTAEVGSKVPNSELSIPIDLKGKTVTARVSVYKTVSGAEYRVYFDNQTMTTTPSLTASNPYELFQKLDVLKVNMNKPVKVNR